MKRFPKATENLLAAVCGCGCAAIAPWTCATRITNASLRRWLFDTDNGFLGDYKMPIALSLSLDGCAVEDLP
jgi:hypothetical protein